MTERAAANSWRSDLLDNPILRREAVPRLIRRASPNTRAILAAFALACSLVVGVFLAGIGGQLGGVIAYAAVYTWAGLTVVFAALHASRSIAQERMSGTWDALVMSRLRGRGIVLGKLLGVLLPLWAVGLLLLPVVLPVALASREPLVVLGYVLIAYASALIPGAAAASLGLYCSMRCRTIMSAQFLTIVLGVIISMVTPFGHTMMVLPMGLLAAVAGAPFGYATFLYGIVGAVLPLLPGFIMLWLLLARFDTLDAYHRGSSNGKAATASSPGVG